MILFGIITASVKAHHAQKETPIVLDYLQPATVQLGSVLYVEHAAFGHPNVSRSVHGSGHTGQRRRGTPFPAHRRAGVTKGVHAIALRFGVEKIAHLDQPLGARGRSPSRAQPLRRQPPCLAPEAFSTGWFNPPV
jgi:hypothetical protein